MIWCFWILSRAILCFHHFSLFSFSWWVFHESMLWLGFPGSSVVKIPPANAGDVEDVGLIPRSGRSPAGGTGNSLQYPCLETPMDRGTRRATVHRVAKSWTLLSWTWLSTGMFWFVRLTLPQETSVEVGSVLPCPLTDQVLRILVHIPGESLLLREKPMVWPMDSWAALWRVMGQSDFLSKASHLPFLTSASFQIPWQWNLSLRS